MSTEFTPEVGESPRDFLVRVATESGAAQFARFLAELPPEADAVRQLNELLVPVGERSPRQFPSADSIRWLVEFPEVRGEVLLKAILKTERGEAVDAIVESLTREDTSA